MKFNLLIVVIIIISSCSSHKQEYDATILNIGKPKQLNDFSDLFSSIEIIPLDTARESYVTSPRKSYFIDDKFYLYDRKNLVVFDKKGKYLHNTKQLKGNSKNEVFGFTDFVVNPYTKNLELLDPMRGSVKIYNDNLKYVNQVKVPKQCRYSNYFDILDSTTYIFRGNNRMLYFYSTDNKQVLDSCSVIGDFPDGTMGSDGMMFHRVGKELYYISRSNNNIIYSINKENGKITLKPEYELIITDNPLKPEHLKNISDKKTFWKIVNEHSVFGRRFITDKHVFGVTIKNMKGQFYIHNRTTNKSMAFYREFASGNAVSSPIVITNSHYYFVFSSEGFNVFFKNYKFDDKTQLIVDKINDDSNLMIVKLGFRDNI